MKFFIVMVAVLTSVVASAAELTVLSIPAKAVARAHLSTRFEVNLQDGTAGVSMTARKTVRHGRNHRTTSKTFEKEVQELALAGNTLTLNIGGTTVDCGTMGETRVFKVPVLNLSGKCDIETRKNGSSVDVVIVTE